MCSSEDSDLKRLLTSWHCEILYNLFREEDINIEELKFIKYRHIVCLLKSYKMGVRIRFEHYLESWRNKLGIPLQIEGQQCPSYCYTCSSQHQQQNGNTDHLWQLGIHENARKSQCSDTQESLSETNEGANHTTLPSPKLLSENYQMPADAKGHVWRSASGKRKERDPPLLEVSEVFNGGLVNSITDTSACNNNQKIISRHNFENCPYTLSQILQMSGSRGQAIIKYYEEHHEFTNTQRTQLIQTICDFYEDNEFHLSLHMSHAIESEILQMFPTEKLHYYRTEKRGKLYVKFTNMKRYRRERGTSNRSKVLEKSAIDKEETVRIQNMAEVSSVENHMDTSCDTWPEGAEADINIKTEEVEEC